MLLKPLCMTWLVLTAGAQASPPAVIPPLNPTAVAQTPGKSLHINSVTKLTLSEAVAQFEQQGFDLLIADAQVLGAQGDLRAAGALNNPQISGGGLRSVGAYNPRVCGPNAGCSVWGFTAGISDQGALESAITGKRRLKRGVASFALETAQRSRDDAQRTLDYAMRLQFLTVALDQARLKFVEDMSATYHESSSLFLARYDAGDISEADLARVEVEALRAEQQVSATQGQLADDRAALAFLLGERGQDKIFEVVAPWLEAVRDHPLTTMPEEAYLEIARKHRPDLLSFKSDFARAQKNLQLMRRQRLPDTLLGLNYQQEGTGQQAIQPPTFGLTLSFALPVFYQQQGEILRAEANVRTQQLLLNKADAQVATDVRRAHQALAFATIRVDRVRSQLFPRAARALRLVQLQYAKGAASLLDLLDARRTALDVKQSYFDAVGDFWGAVLGLEQAIATEVRL